MGFNSAFKGLKLLKKMNHLYRFRLAVTDATVPTVVVVVCGSHVVVD